MKDRIVDWIKTVLWNNGYCPCAKYHDLKRRNDKLIQVAEQKTSEAQACNKALRELGANYDSLKKENVKLMKELQEHENDDDEKIRLNYYRQFWNKKHTARIIKYKGRRFPGTREIMNVPVQNFLMSHDPEIRQLIDEHGLSVINPLECNDTILEIYRLSRKLPVFKYRHDDNTTGFKELWMLPFEYQYKGAGDCDDMGNYLVSMLIAAGVPRFRVRAVAGKCRGINGYHHTVHVLGDDMVTWYHLNSTRPPRKLSGISNLMQLPRTDDPNDAIGISDYFFSYNDMYAWSDFEGDKRDLNEVKKKFDID